MANDQMTVGHGHGQAQDAHVGASNPWNQNQKTNMSDP